MVGDSLALVPDRRAAIETDAGVYLGPGMAASLPVGRNLDIVSQTDSVVVRRWTLEVERKRCGEIKPGTNSPMATRRPLGRMYEVRVVRWV